MRAHNLALAAALLMAADPLQASESRTLVRAGPWEAYVVATDAGRPLCGISQFSGPYGFMIKFNPENDTAFVHLRKNGWSVPREARMAVEFLVDGRQAWLGTFGGTGKPEMIEGHLFGEQAGRFVDRFASGQRLVIRFPAGTEAAWDASLKGTMRVTRAFVECMQRVASAGTPSQPHAATPPPDRSPATQPFAAVRPEQRI